MSTSKKQLEQQKQQQQQQQLEFYRNTLNFNVISRYDPKINNVVYDSPYAVAYKFDQASEEWEKLEYLGLVSVYSRLNYDPAKPLDPHAVQDDFYYGLIILNRSSPANFSIGIVPNCISEWKKSVLMSVEQQGDLVIIQDVKEDVYGIWLFDKKDREELLKALRYVLENPPIKLV
ncbi:hypothetical protein BABINDRAFT_163073 [Babjeviella inositovora NRRL Y-12698]|uniref:mRNA-decapping enzyme subunit 1 n=1 Tax=Babjeviella inositovora NRRL Y-12698 TaxID=984486 RepID=A0A1E3QK23_9ASCO|nr:uncharacterized protein BABINDRAFT_163073 [Babjeviella inositovora NRRL Y-12698]ODQ78035.1 hypothetical protein BABINDRAFT_163073 [Babjeviella inositovora NRRL Y-12698]